MERSPARHGFVRVGSEKRGISEEDFLGYFLSTIFNTA
jgi:hypothetical protein